MKPLPTAVLLLATALLGGCTRKTDIATLESEAVAVSRYYAPRVDALDARVQAIFKRGSTIPATVPGVDQVSAKLTEARDLVLNLRQSVGTAGIEKEAREIARSRNAERLEKLTRESEETLARGVEIVNGDLESVEGWLAQYDNHMLSAPPAAPPAPAPQQ